MDLIERKKAIDIVNAYKRQIDPYPRVVESLEKLPSAQPEPQNDSDRIYAMMKDYYFDHKDEHDVSWQGGFGKCMNLIPNVIEKKAQSEPQWIPCSERLPEQYGNYLISIHGEDEPDIGTINPNDKRGWSLCDANGFHWASDKKLIVTAWMPLPEPYREDGGE